MLSTMAQFDETAGVRVKILSPGTKWPLVMIALAMLCAGCSRQQSDWDKARTANTLESYEQFVKNYPSGDFAAQAQARIKELEEERDWQKARDTDSPEAYQAFLKQYPEGKWTEEARIRIENFSLAQTPSGSPAGTPTGAPTGAATGTPGAADAAEKPAATAPKPAAAKAAPATQPSHTGSATKHAGSKADHASSSGSGHYLVQLGAFSAGKAAAEQGWTHISGAHASLFKGVSHRVVTAKGPKGSLFKLQATGLSRSQAHSLCAALKARQQSCIVIAP